jgi:hypothetical protein
MPGNQLKPIWYAVVTDGTLARFIGGSAWIIIIAPLPGADIYPIPIIF